MRYAYIWKRVVIIKQTLLGCPLHATRCGGVWFASGMGGKWGGLGLADGWLAFLDTGDWG
jgi:hypothetical protein